MRTKYFSSWINENSAIMEEWRLTTVNNRGVFRTQSNIYNEAFSLREMLFSKLTRKKHLFGNLFLIKLQVSILQLH